MPENMLLALLSGLGVFLALQTGLLIWFLSRVNTTLKFINAALERGDLKFSDQSEDIGKLKDRVTVLEAKDG